MRYRILISGFPGGASMMLTPAQYRDLVDCIKRHEEEGFRDGWSTVGRCWIAECGESDAPTSC